MTGRAANGPVLDLDGIRCVLAGGGALEQSLPDALGELFIDRLQPCLCVYRQPADRDDPGTRQLVGGQAAYVVGTAGGRSGKTISALVAALVDLTRATYGAALVLEIWSAPPGSVETERFRIVTERQGVAREAIEALERGLLDATGSGRSQVEVAYTSGASPVGVPPIIDKELEAREDVFLVGLEVPPVYHDPETGRLIPDELRRLARHLGNALKQAFYAFAHTRVQDRPAHFHELGPRALRDAVKHVDHGLAAVGDAFDLLLYATPVNAEEAFARFLASGCNALPELLYRPITLDHAALKRELYHVPVETIEDPALHHIYTNLRDELDRQITMLADRNTPRFLLESQQVFGAADTALMGIASEILSLPDPGVRRSRKTETLSAREFAGRAEEELSFYRHVWPDLPAKVEIRSDIPGIMVSRGHLLVGETAVVRDDRVAPLLHHEIGTHILTYYNGLAQPLSQFHLGMARYEETQEGLAVLSEYLCGGLTLGRLRMLAGRVAAVDSVVQGADFVETWRLLAETHGFARRQAFTIAMRVHRGGGLTKDVVYLRGLISLLDYAAEGGELDDLFVGKIALEDIDIVEELRWRKIVSPGRLRPRYLDDPAARRRMASLPRGTRIADLLKGNVR